MGTFASSFKPIEFVPHDIGDGPQAIDATSTTQNYPLGTRVVAKDPVLGEGEFVYAKGVASTAVGEVIQINGDFTTVRAAGGTIKGNVGIAMSANVANQYGWYCVKGRVMVLVAADVTGDVPAYATATAGTLADDIVAGSQIAGIQLQNGLDAGGSAIPGTSDTTAAHFVPAVIHYPAVLKAI
jgi:hypothetical protein